VTTSIDRACNRSTTPFQLADSANAPWTSTTTGLCSFMRFSFSRVTKKDRTARRVVTSRTAGL
jgi:hypothetical protein